MLQQIRFKGTFTIYTLQNLRTNQLRPFTDTNDRQYLWERPILEVLLFCHLHKASNVFQLSSLYFIYIGFSLNVFKHHICTNGRVLHAIIMLDILSPLKNPISEADPLGEAGIYSELLYLGKLIRYDNQPLQG